MSRPVSAKMMSINPISPYGLRSLRISFGSRLSARMVESRCTTAQDRRPDPAPRERPGVDSARSPHHSPAPIRLPSPLADHTGRPTTHQGSVGLSRGQTTRDRRIESEGEDHRRLPRSRPLHGDGERRAHPRPPAGCEAGAEERHQAPGAPPRHRRRRPLPPDLRRPRQQEARRRRPEGRAQGRERALPRDRRGPRGRGDLVAPARGAQADRAGEADGVPRDHQRGDRGGHRELARPRHEVGRGAGGSAHPRPPRRLRGVERRVPPHRARHVGRARAERRHATRRRPRARAHGVPQRLLLGPRGHVRRERAVVPGHARAARRQSPRARVATSTPTPADSPPTRSRAPRRSGRGRAREPARRRRRSPSRRSRRGTFTEKPKAPFITSTLQQEAGRKLGFSAAAR